MDGIWLGVYDYIGNETNVNYYTNKTLNYYNWQIEYPKTLLGVCVVYCQTGWIDTQCLERYGT